MEVRNFPRTVEEMLEAGWYNRILRKVNKANLKDILNTPEELVQDVFLQIIKSDYLARYNPEYRPFEVYIYSLVDNLIKKRGIREGTEGGKKVVNHASLENAADNADTNVSNPNVIFIDMLEVTKEHETTDDEMFVDDLIEATRIALKEFKASSSVEFNGKLVQRDPLTVFNYILEGKSVSEIAEIMQVSKQYIYVLLHKIRAVKTMQDFYNNALENNLVFNNKVSC